MFSCLYQLSVPIDSQQGHIRVVCVVIGDLQGICLYFGPFWLKFDQFFTLESQRDLKNGSSVCFHVSINYLYPLIVNEVIIRVVCVAIGDLQGIQIYFGPFWFKFDQFFTLERHRDLKIGSSVYFMSQSTMCTH